MKRIGLSLLLVAALAIVLLWSDRNNRVGYAANAGADGQLLPVAILQHSSTPMMEELRDGALHGMRSKGFIDGKTIAVSVFNPEGDLPTGNLMAQKIVGGDYRLGLSISTVMLQALANANRNAKIQHVFGGVTAPVTVGVGINALDSLDKPPYMTGIGTPQPVKEIFRLAKHLNPGLHVVGVVWNPTEANSEFCTQLARQVSAELGLSLLEAPIEQTKDVREAAASLVGRGAQAFWTGGDATVNTAVDSLLEVAHNAHIPVFSNITGHTQRGALFDYGANYYEVGEEIGRIAAQVLSGASPAKIPVRNYVPQHLVLNEQVAQSLGSEWSFDGEWRLRADSIIDRQGKKFDLRESGEGAAAPR